MKKLISLFLVVAMISSFMIVAQAETKVNLKIEWYGTKTSGPGGRNIAVDWDNTLAEGANPGDTIAAYIYTPANTYLSAIGFKIKYDESILTYKENSAVYGAGWTAAVGNQGNGVLKVGAAQQAPSGDDYAEFGTIMFTVNAAPVKTKDTLISIELDTSATNTYNPGGGAATAFTADEFVATFIPDPVKINGVEEPAAEFEVTAVDNGANTVVTVANKGDKTGKVYVATFVGGVLDACQVKDLADGDLTFEGLTGDVKVYVWDNNMVPLLDTALDA